MDEMPPKVHGGPLPTITLIVASLVAGGVLGWLCARFVFVGSGWALLPWAAVGIGLGAAASTWIVAASCGAIYGFALGSVFMVAGYAGAAPLSSVLLPFAGLGLIAAIGGLACGELGWIARSAAGRIASSRKMNPKI